MPACPRPPAPINPFKMTFTGADDTVEPERLIALSKVYPFIEWGILISGAEKNWSARFPSLAWIRRFLDLCVEADHDVARSAHLCSNAALYAMSAGVIPGTFTRVQINGWDRRHVGIAARHVLENDDNAPVIILQCRDERDLGSMVTEARAFRRSGRQQELDAWTHADILIDPSGGRGVRTEWFPIAPSALRFGYAGGIAVDNVVDVLTTIEKRRHPFWLDMETGCRDRRDCFSIATCEMVAMHVHTWRLRQMEANGLL